MTSPVDVVAATALPMAGWAALRLTPASVQGIEVLQAEKRRSVFRLEVGGKDVPTMVLKRCPADQAAREITFYRNVLPRLDVPALRLFANVEVSDAETWFLMEDAGTCAFEVARPDHRALAASWLGRFQRAGARADLPDVNLRDRGPDHFWQHVDIGTRALADFLADESGLAAEQRELLAGLLDQMRAVGRLWPVLTDYCARYPVTLVHGDFKPDNLRVRESATGSDLVVFDWNEGGMGVPCLDLSRFLRSAQGSSATDTAGDAAVPLVRWIHDLSPDLGTYLEAVQPVWPILDAESVVRLGYVGELFRCVASIRWQAARLRYGWVDGPLSHLAYFDDWLRQLVCVLEDR